VTSYLILKRDENNHWAEHVYVDASSGRRAIMALSATEDVTAGEYLAVPQRSFKPMKVALEQTTKITIT
jgi:hypothetical protein